MPETKEKHDTAWMQMIAGGWPEYPAGLLAKFLRGDGPLPSWEELHRQTADLLDED